MSKKSAMGLPHKRSGDRWFLLVRFWGLLWGILGVPGGISGGPLGDLGANLVPIWLPDIYRKSNGTEKKEPPYEQKINVGASP